MTCNHVINDMLFRCDRCGVDKNDIANEARENRMDAYFRYGVSTQGETRMTTDEAAGRMVHTPTEAPRVLEAPGVTRLRLAIRAALEALIDGDEPEAAAILATALGTAPRAFREASP